MDNITSLQNERVKTAAKLRDRRQRGKQGRFLIDGVGELLMALRGGVPIVEAFVCESLCQSPDCRAALEQLSRTNAVISHVTPPVLAKVAYGDRAEGIVAVAKTPQTQLSELRVPVDAVVAVLVGVEKPGNVGAVLRSADAAGISAVVIADGRTDLFNPNCIRASLGTVFTLNVCEATTEAALAWLRARGKPIYAARVDAQREYTDCDFRSGGVIVLGSEATGLSPAWQAPGITPVRLPMQGTTDSLNVSAAAAVLFYEALRQKRL